MDTHELRVNEWKENRDRMYDETYDFVKSTRTTEDRVEALKDIHAQVFSEVDCMKCANCCRTTPAIVTKKDAKRIAPILNMPPKTFLRKYTIEDISGDIVMNTVPCPFLQGDNACKIYDVRPDACRQYPHTDEDAYFQRAKLNAENTIVCPAAYHIAKKIKKRLV